MLTPKLPDPVSDITAGVLQMPVLSLSPSLFPNPPKELCHNKPAQLSPSWADTTITRDPPLGIALPTDTHFLSSYKAEGKATKHCNVSYFQKEEVGKNCSLIEKQIYTWRSLPGHRPPMQVFGASMWSRQPDPVHAATDSLLHSQEGSSPPPITQTLGSVIGCY